MISIRKADQRGTAKFDWLDSKHTFSFGNYYDPKHMGFGVLRVINEDRVQPERGFDTHGHRDMEIISYVLDGEIEHKDSLGNGSIIRPGDVQRMSAGTGVRHSEFNPSRQREVHFLQIWIVPERDGLEPSYQQRSFAPDELRGALRLVAAHDGRDGAVTIHQDVDLYAARFAAGERALHTLAAGRKGWVQVARGRVDVNGEALAAGDGAAFAGESNIELVGVDNAEVLVFDMAG